MPSRWLTQAHKFGSSKVAEWADRVAEWGCGKTGGRLTRATINLTKNDLKFCTFTRDTFMYKTIWATSRVVCHNPPLSRIWPAAFLTLCLAAGILAALPSGRLRMCAPKIIYHFHLEFCVKIHLCMRWGGALASQLTLDPFRAAPCAARWLVATFQLPFSSREGGGLVA